VATAQSGKSMETVTSCILKDVRMSFRKDSAKETQLLSTANKTVTVVIKFHHGIRAV
jgi:hypothetical protein